MSVTPDNAAPCARYIAEAFAAYNAAFRTITRRAPQRFATRDWQGSLKDAVERIDLYDRYVNASVAHLRDTFGAPAPNRDLWREIRRQFEGLIASLPDREFVKTFFSSITRRLF